MIIIPAIVILSLPQKWISWSVYLQSYLFTYSTHMTVSTHFAAASELEWKLQS